MCHAAYVQMLVVATSVHIHSSLPRSLFVFHQSLLASLPHRLFSTLLAVHHVRTIDLSNHLVQSSLFQVGSLCHLTSSHVQPLPCQSFLFQVLILLKTLYSSFHCSLT